jgi:5'-3' exonuclease
MGIKNLHKFLRKNCPNVYTTVHLSNYAFKKVAIDISLYMFKYKTVFGDSWLQAFVNLVACLRKNEIHCLFVYDNGCPIEKMKEREDRIASREKIRDKIKLLERQVKEFYSTNEIGDEMQEIYNKYGSSNKVKRLLSNKVITFDINVVEERIAKIKGQVVKITSGDFELTKELFEIIGVPWILANGEAETTCSHLCVSNVVDAVMSEDTDVLAYNTPLFLTKINSAENTCVVIKVEDILESLEITYETFRDLCIMCGTDYNKNIPRIGPETSFKLLKNYKTIDGIAENTVHDVTILNHVRSRELFTANKEMKTDIPFCTKPDWENLNRFLFENNCNVNISYIKNCFSTKELVFSDD